MVTFSEAFVIVMTNTYLQQQVSYTSFSCGRKPPTPPLAYGL